MSHRILPGRAEPRAPNADATPLRHFKLVAAILFLSLFALFSLIILASRLHPSLLTGHDINASVAATVNVSESPLFTCDAEIPAGTSLKSFPCLPVDIDRTEFLGYLSADGADVLAMYRYSPWTAGRWLVYNSSLPNYTVQSLDQLGRLDGVYFVMAAPELLDYSGALPHSTAVPLRQGWNLAGYPSNLTTPLDVSLASINDTYTEIKALEGTEEAGTYLVALNPGGGGLTNTSLYYGYWIYLNASDSWTVAS